MLNVVLTCEHAVNKIPDQYAHYFTRAAHALDSHEGLDIGALQLAQVFAQQYPTFFYTEISRLLVEVNRSIGHPQLFSRFLTDCPADQKELLLATYYHPYRIEVRQAIEKRIADAQRVLHLSIHTFTPELGGVIRNGDIGLLYDPSRSYEKDFCAQWKHNLLARTCIYKIRYNYPYLGKSDGFVTYLRKEFPPELYLAIELEVNQKFFLDYEELPGLEQLLLQSFGVTLSNFHNP